jgi:putative inorganic carbon (HCO3(-)) transporter
VTLRSIPGALRPRARGWPPPAAGLLIGGVGVALGVAAAWLPLAWAVGGLIAAAVVALALIDPVYGLAAALILGPTKPLTDAYAPALPLDAGQIALILTLGAWFLHAARRGEVRVPASPFNVPLLVFVGVALLSLTDALSLGYGLNEVIKWAQIVVVMWLAVDFARRGRLGFVVGAVLTSAAVQAAIGVWQFGLRGNGPEQFLILGGRFYRAYGTFEQPNPYGGFVGMALAVACGVALGALMGWARPVGENLRARRPLSARRVLRAASNAHAPALIGLIVLAGLLLAGLLASWSRGAWLGFGAAAFVMLAAWPRRAWIGLLLAAGAVLAAALAMRFNLLPGEIAARLTGFTAYFRSFDVRGVDINDLNFSVIERLAHWQAAREMARHNFWLGVGIGNYEPVYAAYALMNWPYPLGHAHNFYLNLFAETGIIGLIAYGALWIVVLWQTWRATRGGAPWQRGLAIGLLGAWTHLLVHSLVDKLYVANLHLHVGVLLGALSYISMNRTHKTEAA